MFISTSSSSASEYPAVTSRASFDKIYGLDGLRFIAAAIVVIRHLEINVYVPGGLGVTVFFFISGFLISRLLLAEECEKGKLDIPAFFTRRFIRLLPPLVLMYLVMVPILYFYLPEKFTWASAFYNFFTWVISMGCSRILHPKQQGQPHLAPCGH